MKRFFLLLLCVSMILAVSVSAEKPVLKNAEVFRFLPSDTLFFIATGNFQSLLDKLGREKIIEKYREIYESMGAELEQGFGLNPIVPEDLRKAGVEPAGMAGLAFASVDPEMVVFFFSVSDGGKLFDFIGTMAENTGMPMKTESLADGKLLSPDNPQPEVYLYLRGNFLFVFTGNWSFQENAMSYIGKFVQPAGSLADDDNFIKTCEKLNFGGDIGAYLNVGAVIDSYVAAVEREVSEPYRSYNRDYLEELESQESSEEELEYWRQMVEEDEQWHREYTENKKTEAQAVKMYLGSISGLAMGMEIAKDAFQVAGYLGLNSDSPILRICKNAKGPQPIVQRLSQRPLALLSSVIDVPAATEFLRTKAGDEFEQMVSEMKKHTSLDFEKDVLGMFSGDMGWALTGKLDEHSPNLEQEIGFSAIVGIADQLKALKSLGQLAMCPEMSKMLCNDSESGGYILSVPDWKNLHLVPGDKCFTISETLEFSQGKGESFASSYGKKSIEKILSKPGYSMLFVLDSELIAGLMTAFNSAFNGSWDSGISEPSSSEVWEEYPDVPYSEEYLQKKQEIEALTSERDGLCSTKDAEIAAMDQELSDKNASFRQEEMETTLRIIRRFGQTVMTAKVDGNGLYLFGGQFIAEDSVSDFMLNTVDDSITMNQKSSEFYAWQGQVYDNRWQTQSARDEIFYEYESRISEMQWELQEIRRQDVEKTMWEK